MRKYFFLIAIISCQFGYTQLIIKPIIKESSHMRGRVSTSLNSASPASLPFWDDFSISLGDSPDSIRVWEGDTARQWDYERSKDVYVNSTLAINPPTYRVVTFDGLDANGGFNTSADPWADQLQSDTLDLLGRTDVTLSFYWQAGGHVELPEKGDSIRLQFYSPNIASNEGWQTVWAMDGENLASDQDSIFTQVEVDLSSVFLTQDFVFRFQSFGDKDGPFDAWHLDYIFLDDNRAEDDFYYEDISLNSLPSSPFTPFTSIPSNQLFNDLPGYSGSVTISASALEKPDVSGVGVPAEYSLELFELTTATRIDSVDFGDQPTIPVNDDPFQAKSNIEISTSSYDLSGLIEMDSLVIETKVFIRDNIDTVFNPLNIDQFNDTIRTRHIIHNYYSYDDGTAEYAAGTNINGGQVAVKFWVEEPDTLTHVDIHFPSIDPLSEGSSLELRIFSDLDNEPIRTQNISVINKSGLNAFQRYQLAPQVIVSDTFYVGYQQSKNEYIGIGFDRSNPQASEFIYENKTGEWEQNERLQGALMIRPVFAKVDSFILSAKPQPQLLTVYPNPTQGLLNIQGNYESISLIDFSGRILMRQSATDIHDFSSLKAGLYLLTIHRKEGDQTLKIIKK